MTTILEIRHIVMYAGYFHGIVYNLKNRIAPGRRAAIEIDQRKPLSKAPARGIPTSLGLYLIYESRLFRVTHPPRGIREKAEILSRGSFITIYTYKARLRRR